MSPIHQDAEPVLQRLHGSITGRCITPDEADYDEARRVWNGMIDRGPLAIIRAASTDDVGPTINAARELRVPLAIRGGGHNVAGNGTVEDGLVLDLGGLNEVAVDPEARTVTVGPGATLGDVDRATAPHGLAVPTGVVSGTGMAGLTLGGGVGWQTRAYGLTADNLISAEVVNASGVTVRASDLDDADLLWGLRGGGGNFGVTTSFTYRAYPLGPKVFAGTFVYGPDRWRTALRAMDAWARDLPDEITAITTTLTPPPEFELGHDPVMLVGFASTSPDRARGEALVAPLREAAPPDAEVVDPVDWPAWQSQADLLFPKGVRAYWKNTSFDRLDDEVIEVIVRRGLEQTWFGTAFDIHHMEGAFGRIGEDATPFPGRSARYWLNIYGFWPDAADDEARIAFVRGLANDMAPFASGGTYVNFMGHEGPGQDARAAALAVYGPAKLARLQALKQRMDPDNLFRLNHNIPPG
ncbi:MAG: FAD-binding oxidoreductase [Chloroflexota bacterium]